MAFAFRKPVSSETYGLRSRLERGASALVLAALLGLGTVSATLVETAMPARAEEAAGAMIGRAPASFADIVDKVKGSVVSIYVVGGGDSGIAPGMEGFPDLPEDHPLNEFFKRFKKSPEGNQGPDARPGLAQGSGFVISTDGYVVTNNHVVAESSKLEVSFDGEEKFPAELIGTDPRTDLALLKVKTDRPLTPVPFAATPARVGDWVIAVGNPFGLGGTVTAGIVSARGRDIGSGPYDYLQIDAAVNRGNSGGPSFNLDGEVVGVNTAIFSPSGGNVGIAFAVPAEIVQEVVAQLKTTGSVSRGWLGVHIQNVTEDIAQSLGMAKAYGALITQVTADGPAAKSDLKAGDAVVAVNGEVINNSRDLARKIADLSPDADAELKVVRDGKEEMVTVKLGQFPSDKQLAKLEQGGSKTAPETADLTDLGLSLAPASALGQEDQKDGVLVTKVVSASEAAEKGLQSGDIILEVAGNKVSTPGDVTAGVEQAKERGRKAVLFRVKSGADEKFVALSIAKG